MSIESTHRGYGSYKEALTAGSYHNGPFSIVIPFGLWGVLAFCWFLYASIVYLYGHYRNGDPRLRTVNTFLLAAFLAKMVFFLLVFGMFYMDLPIFTGLVGLSVCLNGRAKPSARSKPSQRDHAPRALSSGAAADKTRPGNAERAS